MTTPLTTPDAGARLLNVRYAEKEYWNNRYTTQPCEFDWFFGYTALRKLVRLFVKRSKLVLHVGCGNSNFQEGMAKDGYQVINTDISEVVIEQMRAKHRDLPGLRYVVSDCRKMPEFLDCQFGSVIDKGTVDALLCSKDASENITCMFREISRVLVPGGTFLLITLGGPAQRLALVNKPEFGWSVQVCLVRRAPDDSYAPSAPGRAIPLNDTTRPLSFIGPLAVQPDGTVEGLPEPLDPASYFYAYACRKAPLVLPADNSSAARSGLVRLPEGWRATVRAVAEVIGGEMGLPQGILGRGRRVKVTTRASFERRQRELQQTQQGAVQQQADEDASANESPASLPSDCPSCSTSATGVKEDSHVRSPRQEAHCGGPAGGVACRAADEECPGGGAGPAGLWRACAQPGAHTARQSAAGAGAPASSKGQDASAVGEGPHAVAAAAAAGPRPPPLCDGAHAPQLPGRTSSAPDAEVARPPCGALRSTSQRSMSPAVLRVARSGGSAQFSRNISFSRLSDTVHDAFARLDAVDGDGHSSCEGNATRGSPVADARGRGK